MFNLRPRPGQADRHQVERQADGDQEAVIGTRVCGQSDDVEQEKEPGYTNVRLAVDRLPQHQGQNRHDHGDPHESGNPQPHVF